MSWRPCPFTPGKRYRVVGPLQAHRDIFQGGEILTFDEEAYSAYHGMTGYFFHDESGKHRAYDVGDDVVGTPWLSAFEPVDPA